MPSASGYFQDIRKVIERMTRIISLIVLGAASLALSRAVFFFINDPEGPNLLIVAALATIIFCASWAAYALVHRALRPDKVK
jgi:hypothetical protein